MIHTIMILQLRNMFESDGANDRVEQSTFLVLPKLQVVDNRVFNTCDAKKLVGTLPENHQPHDGCYKNLLKDSELRQLHLASFNSLEITTKFVSQSLHSVNPFRIMSRSLMSHIHNMTTLANLE